MLICTFYSYEQMRILNGSNFHENIFLWQFSMQLWWCIIPNSYFFCNCILPIYCMFFRCYFLILLFFFGTRSFIIWQYLSNIAGCLCILFTWLYNSLLANVQWSEISFYGSSTSYTIPLYAISTSFHFRIFSFTTFKVSMFQNLFNDFLIAYF